MLKNPLKPWNEGIKLVRNSNSKLQNFHEECAHLGMKPRTLPLDIHTRWNSTYLMLQAAIPYQSVFDRFFDGSDFKSIPTILDWNNAAIIKEFLKIFYESTKLFSGSKYVTSSAFCFQLSRIAMVLKKYSEQPRFKNMCEDMIDKYRKYWHDIPVALGLASCLDPRYKLSALSLCLELNYEFHPEHVEPEPSQSDGVEQPPDVTESESDPEACKKNVVEKKVKAFKKKMGDLFDVYAKKMNNVACLPTVGTSSVFEEEDLVSALLSQRREASIQTCKSDLQRYLDQPTIQASGKEFDVLGWWKAQESMYPMLAAMARDLLSIPVSTVASEAAFSTSGRIVSKSRSSLLPGTVEALMCLRDWYQAEEHLQDEAIVEVEVMMAEEPL